MNVGGHGSLWNMLDSVFCLQRDLEVYKNLSAYPYDKEPAHLTPDEISQPVTSAKRLAVEIQELLTCRWWPCHCCLPICLVVCVCGVVWFVCIAVCPYITDCIHLFVFCLYPSFSLSVCLFYHPCRLVITLQSSSQSSCQSAKRRWGSCSSENQTNLERDS